MVMIYAVVSKDEANEWLTSQQEKKNDDDDNDQ